MTLDSSHSNASNGSGPKSRRKRSRSRNKLKKDSEDATFCAICKNNFTNADEFYRHKTTKHHLVEFLKYWLKRHEKDLMQDKFGISISCLELEKSVPSLIINTCPNQSTTATFNISNNGTDEKNDKVSFLYCGLLHKLKYITLDDEYKVVEEKKIVVIPPDMSYHVTMTVRMPHVGQYVVPLAFQFSLQNDNQPFHIVRWIVIQCGNSIVSSVQPSSPYKPPSFITTRPPAQIIIAGKSLVRFKELDMLEKYLPLPEYYIPEDLKTVVEHNLKSWKGMSWKHAKLLEVFRLLLNQPLNSLKYHEHFETMIYLEEIQKLIDVRTYDLEDVPMFHGKQKDLIMLEVPGLTENRPSVMTGDHLFVRLRDCNADVEFEGIVHMVQSTKVLLGFGKKFLGLFIDGMKVDVRFTVPTQPLRLLVRAVHLTRDWNMWPLLFPTYNTAALAVPLMDTLNIRFFNRQIEDNPEQQLAVRTILAGTARPAPYLLFGPPGTGKTVTLVEAVKQVWKCFSESRILICTPSNSAANVITQRLLSHIPDREIFRMCAASYPWEKLPDKVKPCSTYDSVKCGYLFPPKKVIQQSYRIIVTTLFTSGRLVSADFPTNYFTHIFIDEAGHSCEPESIIPISGLMRDYDAKVNFAEVKYIGGHLILAGDPKQLGPIIRSSQAQKNGFDISLLQRLMENSDIYQQKNGQYDARVLTKLIRNYRSHPEILRLPNKLFYDEELQAHATEGECNAFCMWECLPHKNFPLLFHGVRGRDMREARSPSYFNPEEIAVVIEYVQDLLNSKSIKMKVKPQDIGIISPYRRQVQKLKYKMQELNYSDLAVGSVEEFQGQERKVIIISTVRSTPDLLAMDYEYRLGFLSNPKRFNVALTRAKSLLIIVGNPHILSRDKYWNELLNFCWHNGSYVGTPYEPSDGNDIDDLVYKFKELELVPETSETYNLFNGCAKVSQKTLQEEPRWKSQ